jgi:mannosyltransferase OCH1-like enzyme
MKYTEEDFNTMIRRSVNYSQKEQDTSEGWAIFKELYTRNYLQVDDTVSLIPRKLHQIWLGGQLPDKWKKYTETWQRLHPSWEYKLWTDVDVDSIVITRKDVFDSAQNLGQKSDILRYEILRQQGGVYVDTDFECLKPLDDLLFLEFFTGISTDADAQLYIGILGSIPNHPIMVRCTENPQRAKDWRDGNEILLTTGVFYFTRCFFEIVNRETKGVVAFPMSFFYPFPNHLRFTDTAYTYIKPNSYAIHHWKTSWLYP